jgi:acyl-CoA thioester hydrolase
VQALLDGFRFVHEIKVIFRDLDSLGHVNNAVYLTYLETARLAYWAEVVGMRRIEELGVILARAEVDFRSPAVFGETLLVGVRATSLKRSSFAMHFRIVSSASASGPDGNAEPRVVAEAKKVLVSYDYSERRPAPISEALRAALRRRDPDLSEEI